MPIIPAFLIDIHREESMAKLRENPNFCENYLPSTEAPVYIHSFRGQARTYEKDGYNPGEKDQEIERSFNSSNINESTNKTKFGKEIPDLKEKELRQESTEVGVLFASKPVVQAITNPFIGPLTNK